MLVSRGVAVYMSGFYPEAWDLVHFCRPAYRSWRSSTGKWQQALASNTTYATERMLLQQVGGRYRVTTNLLRDHSAAMEPRQVKSG